MAKLYNLAKMTSATIGTGTITLGSAVSGFLTFAQAGVQDGETIAYAISDNNGAIREIGYGVYASAGTTLTRNVRKSNNSNNPIVLTGSEQIMITPAAEDIINADGSIPFSSDVNFGNHLLFNVSDPTGTYDAINKHYLDIRISGTQSSLGFTPEDVVNKTQTVRASGTSSTLYPSESAVSGFVASSIANIPAAGGNIGSFLLSGGGVTWVTGYQFRVSAAQYYIQGVLYSSAEQLITLTSSDASFDRIDVIVVNTSGQVDKVTGAATSSPSEPDIDPATQLQLAFIIVYAASSSPIINSQTIYSEKAGSPTEWNWSSTGSTWNLASTNNPFAGTKDIEATNLGANAYAQGMATGTANLSLYTQLNFYVRSKATWNTGRGLYIAWYSNGVRKGNNVFLAHGFFNFNSDNVADYQLISIPISQFAVPNGTTVNQLRFTRVGGAIGFYLDEIVVTDSGLTSTPVGLTQDQADARYVLKTDFIRQMVFSYAGNLAIGSGATRIYHKTGKAAVISQVFVAINTPPTINPVIIDINKNGTTIFTTQSHRPSIPTGTYTTFSTSIDVSTLSDGDYMTLDIDQIGSGTAGSDLTAHVIYS